MSVFRQDVGSFFAIFLRKLAHPVASRFPRRMERASSFTHIGMAHESVATGLKLVEPLRKDCEKKSHPENRLKLVFFVFFMYVLLVFKDFSQVFLWENFCAKLEIFLSGSPFHPFSWF